MAGVSERFVRFVEQGKRTVQLDTLLALLGTLGLELQLTTRTSAAARALDQPRRPAGGRARARRTRADGGPAMRHRIADVYKAGVLAARLERHDGGTRFSYLPAYLAAGGPAVASSLPLTAEPVLSAAGAAPPYFTGLLPEGRRLNALRRSIKTSVDDDLSLLIAAGGNPVGDVQIVGHGETLDPEEHAVEVDPEKPVDFDELLGDSGLIDPVALAGVQDKLSAGMISMPVASAGRRFILKLNAPEFPHVVENEFMMFRYAAKLRIPLSRVQLMRDVAGRPGLLVERFDRVPVAGGAPDAVQRLAVEDGAQVLGLYPADKYNVGFGKVCHALAEYCAAPLPALRNLAIQAAFAWLSGNGDLHAKNVSMVQQPQGSGPSRRCTTSPPPWSTATRHSP